jgi:hypothetical protein
MVAITGASDWPGIAGGAPIAADDICIVPSESAAPTAPPDSAAPTAVVRLCRTPDSPGIGGGPPGIVDDPPGIAGGPPGIAGGPPTTDPAIVGIAGGPPGIAGGPPTTAPAIVGIAGGPPGIAGGPPGIAGGPPTTDPAIVGIVPSESASPADAARLGLAAAPGGDAGAVLSSATARV